MTTIKDIADFYLTLADTPVYKLSSTEMPQPLKSPDELDTAVNKRNSLFRALTTLRADNAIIVHFDGGSLPSRRVSAPGVIKALENYWAFELGVLDGLIEGYIKKRNDNDTKND